MDSVDVIIPTYKAEAFVADSSVRLAIVGCGLITENSHLPAALRSPHVRLVALVDSNVERARELARKYACAPMTLARINDVLPEVDGVLIATPNHTHADVAEAVLKAGLPVLVEKPLTTDHTAALQLCQLARDNNTFIAVGYKTRHYPSIQLMKELLSSGFFGIVHSFHYEFGSRGGWAPVSAYNLDRRQTGGGVLVTSGTHFLDRMLYWFSDPRSFDFQDDSYGGPEANCRATFRYEGDLGKFKGTIQLSKTFSLRNRFTMETEYYHCELADSDAEEIIVTPHSRPGLQMRLGRRSDSAKGQVDYFQVQIEEFAECIRTRKPPLVDGWCGARLVKLVEELYARRTPLAEPWVSCNPTARELHA